jgi:hypothetical protein
MHRSFSGKKWRVELLSLHTFDRILWKAREDGFESEEYQLPRKELTPFSFFNYICFL